MAANPALFDGSVFFTTDWAVEDGVLRGTCLPASYRVLFWWKRHGRPDPSLWHAFGTCVIVAADGALLLGQMAAHTAAAGMVYFPGGSFGPEDIRDGRLDPAACIARELTEETGLTLAPDRTDPGLVAVASGRSLALARVLRLTDPADAARDAILSGPRDRELSDIRIARDATAADWPEVPEHAKALIRAFAPRR